MSKPNSLYRFTHAPLPTAELLSSDTNAAYARTLRHVLRASGVSGLDEGQALIGSTDRIELQDGSVVVVSGEGYNRVMLMHDRYHMTNEYPDASITVLKTPEDDDTNGMFVAEIAVLSFNNRIFVPSQVEKIYRPANVEDDEVLAPVFANLEATT